MGSVVWRYIHNYTHFIILLIHVYPCSTCTVLAHFFGHILIYFFFILVSVIFVQYSKCFSKNIRDRSKIEITLT